MTEQHADERIQESGKRIKRRGILAAAGAVVAGIVAKKAALPVAATDINSAIYYHAVDPFPNNFVLWADGRSLASNENAIGVRADGRGSFQGIYAAGGNNNGTGIRGDGLGNGNGVEGNGAGTGLGVYGAGSTGVYGTGGTGVFGTGGTGVTGTGSTTGVYGSGSTTGVYAVGTTGVYGQSSGDTNSKAVYGHHTGNGYGVYGDASTGGWGVTGIATTAFGVIGASGSGIGMQGQSASNIGVKGITSTGYSGVYGLAGSTQGTAGTVGVATTAGTIGFAGVAYAPATDAGYFTGNVSVFGNFVVTGTKSAAVKDKAGNHRLVYCEEAPESWFADYGKAKLVNGAATVTLDPEFAALIHSDDYHVFMTEYDDHNALYATNLGPGGFTVRSKGNAGASGTFSWRVVGRRADVTGERLGKVTLPTLTLKLPDVPTTPATPRPATGTTVVTAPELPPVPVLSPVPVSSPVPAPSQARSTGSVSPAATPPQGSGTTQGNPPSPVQPAPPPRP